MTLRESNVCLTLSIDLSAKVKQGRKFIRSERKRAIDEISCVEKDIDSK